MKTIKIFIQTLILFFITQHASAQIGYQVSLLNSATGEPRASETVSVSITLSNSEGKTIHTETKTETTNDFGILSLAVGNENTFNDVDWSKLPFFISVSVDGKLVGKSQILTVPVAEYAKKTGVLTKEILCSKTWSYENEDDSKWILTFYDNNTIKFDEIYRGYSHTTEYTTYYINGDTVYFLVDNGRSGMILHYIYQTNELVWLNSVFK
jgi:hypothetical protein